MKIIKKITAVALSLSIIVCASGASSIIGNAELVVANTVSDDCNDDWLHIEGSKICDKNSNEVVLTGCNWFGYNCTERVLHGLWSCSLKDTIKEMADRGFNIIRVPMSTEVLNEWENGQFTYPSISLDDNPDLIGKNASEIFDKMMEYCKEYGVKVLVDIHSAEAANSGHLKKVWFEGDITTEDFYKSLEYITQRYKNDDTLIALDLKNEPHGNPSTDEIFAKWDNSTDSNNWKYVAETASNKILDINPNMLILVEGVEAYPKPGYDYTAKDEYMNPKYDFNWWGGNLRGVKDYPVNLGERQSQLMYSPHDYGPLVYKQSWFEKDFDQQSLYEDCWKDNWAYIQENGIAPLLIGEWGGLLDDGDNVKWMVALRDFMIERKISHTFWCFNANSGDTGGLVGADFKTWDEAKYTLVKPSLWQDENSKFIGLDHVKGLGDFGLSVSDYYKAITVVIGDIDDNGDVNSVDLCLLRRYILGTQNLNAKGLKAADINCDGNANSVDFDMLKDIILNR